LPVNPFIIVPINPRTNAEVKRPRQYQEILLGLKGPRGGLKKISPLTQKYFKGDFERLNKSIDKSKSGNIILYEEKTTKILRDAKTGEKIYKAGTNIPIFATKITSARPSRKQKPILYVKGKRKRDLDIGFKRGHKRLSKTKERIFLAKPNALKPIAISVKGDTIKSALMQLQVNTTLKDLKKAQDGLFYSVVITIKKPNGELIRIPVSDSWFPQKGKRGKDTKPVDGFMYDRASFMEIPDFRRHPALTQRLNTVSNLHSKMATSIRRALKDSGYRYTTLLNLKKIEDRAIKHELPELQKSADFDEEREEAFWKSLDRLYKYSSFSYYKDLPKQITKRWEVTLYVRFELY
jgi:hypothetical protein